MCLQSCFPSPGFPTFFPIPSSQWLRLGGGSAPGEDGGNGVRELGNCHPTGMGTLQWQPVRTGWVYSALAGPYVFCFCTVLPSPWALALHGGWKQEGCKEGGAWCRLPLACDRFVLWCNQHSLILFDLFFFLSRFCCCYFSCFHRVGSFLPHPSLAPPSPVIHQKPETRNHSGCKGLSVGHWSPALASSSHCCQAVNPTQAARASLHAPPCPHTDPHAKIPSKPEIPQQKGQKRSAWGTLG